MIEEIQSDDEPPVVNSRIVPTTASPAPSTRGGTPAAFRRARCENVRSSTANSRPTPPRINSSAQAQSRPSHTWLLRSQTAPNRSFQNLYPSAWSRPSTITLSVKSLATPSFPPMRMKKVPRVTMKLGSDVFSTMVPLNHPINRAKAKVVGTAR